MKGGVKQQKMFLQTYAFNATSQATSLGGANGIPEQVLSNMGIAGSLLTGAMLVVGIVVVLAIWAYTSFAWMTIAKKLKQKDPGLMWVPLVRTARILQLGGFHWAYIFLVLVPVLGWLAVFILFLISSWRIFEKRKYHGAFALIKLGSLIPFLKTIAGIAWLIILGLVAWKDNK